MSSATAELIQKVLALPLAEQQEFGIEFCQHFDLEEGIYPEMPSAQEMKERLASLRDGTAELVESGEANSKLKKRLVEGLRTYHPEILRSIQ